MDNSSVPANTAHPASTAQQHHVLQAVSLQDYEQLISARASFVDFLLQQQGAPA